MPRDPKLEDRSDLLRRWSEMKTERATWMAHWSELSRYMMPRNGRFFVQDRNRGRRRHNEIYDNTALRAQRVLGAGLMSSLTSPARPWFRLRTPSAELNKSQPVKIWLDECTRLMMAVFAKSNTYRALQQTYGELSVFGTAARIIEPDFQNVIHNHSLTVGEYAIATDWQGKVNTLGREFEQPVAAIVREFGRENCSTAVQNMFDKGTLGAWVPIIHMIEPRDDRDPKSKLARDMPWRSVYFEKGADSGKNLRDGGYKEFPALCSRWEATGGDIYGNSPGMEALGDTKQLQQEQLRKGQAIDYMTRPPVVAPSSMKNADVDFLPGGVSYGEGEVKQSFQVNLNLQHLLADIQDVRERIRSSFYVDLFLMLAQVDVGKMTATEVAAREQEKMLMLGPVVERLHNEELEPLVEFTFRRLLEANLLPPPPQELHGMQLQVELTSILAQAQRAIGANSVDRFVGNLGQIATFAPGVLDKFDADAWVDVYSDQTGVDPSMIVASDKVALIRNNRAQMQQQQQDAAQANQQADTAHKLGNTPLDNGSALAALVSHGGLARTDNVGLR